MQLRRSTCNITQEISRTYSSLLRWILQRVPFFTHCCVALLALLGPILLPIPCAFVLVTTHVIFLLCQTRTAFGIYKCWKGVFKHSTTDWVAEWEREAASLLKQSPGYRALHYASIQHCIILPAYKEDISTLKETLDILASHPLASSNYNVCLGMEARESGGVAKAQNIVQVYRYRGAFRDICFSVHPDNIVGEAAGKSSNVNWAARFISSRIPPSAHAESIITVMDADTAFAADFFLAAAVKYSLAPPEERQRMMFVPPIVFDRNCHEVPVFTRATDIFWCCAGIGGIYESSQCKIPTSAYACSMTLVDFCGYWDGGPEAIGEDLHFYCKALFETKGNIKSVTIYSPASQYNVVGSPARGPIANYISDMKARWTQACRHLWGSLDWSYCWHRTLTGSFGPSSQPTTAYMALRLTADPEGSPAFTSVDKSNAGLKALNIDSGSLPPIIERRIPSPSGSDSSTVYSASSSREAHKVGQIDLPSYAPTPIYSTTAILRVGSDDDDDSGDEAAQPFDDALHRPLRGQTKDLDVVTDDNANPLRRWFRILVLLTRLYEAHLVVAHVFLSMFVLTLLPAVIYRNGTISLLDPYGRKCTWAMCKHALQVTPFAATADLLASHPPGLQPFWMMPDILICSIQLARFLGALGIVATIAMCVIHDFYHAEACTHRWCRSEAALSAWYTRGGSGMPAGYLGIRAHQVSARKWPRALFDYTAIPAGLLYGIFPLLYSQLRHLVTNKLTYVVSAKGKNVVIPLTTEFLRQSMDLAARAQSTGQAATARSSVNLARSRTARKLQNNASFAHISGGLSRHCEPTHTCRSSRS